MPPKRRDKAASSAASRKVAHDSVTAVVGVIPGSMLELPGVKVTEKPKKSLPVKEVRISALAALNAL